MSYDIEIAPIEKSFCSEKKFAKPHSQLTYHSLRTIHEQCLSFNPSQQQGGIVVHHLKTSDREQLENVTINNLK